MIAATGNAVPVKLVEYIGNCILQYAEDEENNNVEAVPDLFGQIAMGI